MWLQRAAERWDAGRDCARPGQTERQSNVMAANDNRTYTVSELAQLAGVSARTLRHYEDVGLLCPARAENGYRTYGPHDVRRLGHVLAMRACGLALSEIRDLLSAPDADIHGALSSHLRDLLEQQRQLQDAVARTNAAIATIERIDAMKDERKFEELKAQAIRENEELYGEEARGRYGDAAIDAANERLLSLSREQWDEKDQLEEAIKTQLREAMAQGDSAGEAARKLAGMHQRWIKLHWGEAHYSREAHLGLAQGYLADPRFRDYYDAAAGEGATDFLVAALKANL